MRGLKDVAPPLALKAGDLLLPFADVRHLDIWELEQGVVRIEMKDGAVHEARGFDAIEAVMAVKPSAVEGVRLRWKPHAWAFHNLIAHPVVQVLAWCGWKRAAVRFHDWTTPAPREFRKSRNAFPPTIELVAPTWFAMRHAPRDGTPLLLLHADRGIVEGFFSPSHWTEDSHISPSEFQGAVWMLGADETEEIEVEEYGPDAPAPYDDGPLQGWLPRTILPDLPDTDGQD